MATAAIDQQYAQRRQELLPRQIQFIGAVTQGGGTNQNRTKYQPINPLPSLPTAPSPTNGTTPASAASNKPALVRRASETLLSLEWRQAVGQAAGLSNKGNTCYLNSTLQCLAYTAPLVQFLKDNASIQAECTQRGQNCALCILQKHFQSTYSGGQRVVSPDAIFRMLPKLNKEFKRIYDQQDAHEFLRLFMEHVEKSCSNHRSIKAKWDQYDEAPRPTDPDPSYKPPKTSLVFSIFGGYLQSQVKCKACGYESNTYDPYMDLNLDVTPRVETSLARFTKPEILDGENKYRCPKCHKKQPSVKQLTVFSVPSILTISLKRFHWTGRKIGTQVSYPAALDISPFMSQKKNSEWYDLFGVLMHHGSTAGSGHYTCVAKTGAGNWIHCDDSSVSGISGTKQLENQNSAYLLFYKRRDPQAKQLSTDSKLSQDLLKSIGSQSKSKSLIQQVMVPPVLAPPPIRTEEELGTPDSDTTTDSDTPATVSTAPVRKASAAAVRQKDSEAPSDDSVCKCGFPCKVTYHRVSAEVRANLKHLSLQDGPYVRRAVCPEQICSFKSSTPIGSAGLRQGLRRAVHKRQRTNGGDFPATPSISGPAPVLPSKSDISELDDSSSSSSEDDVPAPVVIKPADKPSAAVQSIRGLDAMKMLKATSMEAKKLTYGAQVKNWDEFKATDDLDEETTTTDNVIDDDRMDTSGVDLEEDDSASLAQQKKEIMDRVNKEAAANFKKRKRSQYDIDYDRGKLKKVKTKENGPETAIGAPNKFQTHADKHQRNKNPFSFQSDKKKGFKNKNHSKSRMVQRNKRKLKK